MTKIKPTVYSCSGCSSAAQMANYIAVQLDRSEIAEMSCIAGVGGNVKPLVNKAKSANFIITLDGCALKCSQACLSQHNIQPKLAIVLSDYAVEKKIHQDYSVEKANEIFQNIKILIFNSKDKN